MPPTCSCPDSKLPNTTHKNSALDISTSSWTPSEKPSLQAADKIAAISGVACQKNLAEPGLDPFGLWAQHANHCATLLLKGGHFEFPVSTKLDCTLFFNLHVWLSAKFRRQLHTLVVGVDRDVSCEISGQKLRWTLYLDISADSPSTCFLFFLLVFISCLLSNPFLSGRAWRRCPSGVLSFWVSRMRQQNWYIISWAASLPDYWCHGCIFECAFACWTDCCPSPSYYPLQA